MTLPDFLTRWPYDKIVITGSRLTLYHFVEDYQDGKDLAEWYPDLSPEMIDKVLGFYRDNKAEVDEYMARQQEQARIYEANSKPGFNLEELRRRAELKKGSGH